MIFGKLELGETSLHTHNDSYVLASVSVVSTRRPFRPAGLMIGALTGLFAMAFLDILYVGEIAALITVTVLSLLGGWHIGCLQLTSRDLRGSPIAEAVYGSYSHLNRLRPKIIEAVERAKSQAVS
ncbi:hypothetical protein [Leisingera aquaemixtae]|uniref:Uncharacterized protein n=1 Tax=Leisingera aquaemixtae TaxID=1396826 RepID=A0A0P1HPI3_9RHOB|nr:hypothetical protein [Leisingera aquaemixtae]CUI01870.1 hypothetical protein PHA8399_04019 [Leisingera aquaemixtae]